ncbi:MAG: nicotinate-nucleotide--dimethylbenzimidazole phosphoribosyltransferase [Spirochaetia bacterium]|nr:nicotinate-nucleotide--dimethylbenzimidazole phosphoribosyltransferase [Spirochaetia bacterium]
MCTEYKNNPISPINVDIQDRVKERWANKVKPEFSLGYLEEIVTHLALITGGIDVTLTNPNLLLFAGDHHITQEGVSNSAPEITYQQVINFSKGGGAVGLLAKENNINLKVVDCGVNYDFDPSLDIINKKVGYGAANFLSLKAMSEEDALLAMENGKSLIDTLVKENCNVVLFGEMGIGNTTSASAITSSLLNLDASLCTSQGAGLFDWQIEHKIEVIKKGQLFHGKESSPISILSTYGGYEIATMVGSLLEAAHKKMVIIIDGFVTSCALLVASFIDKEVTSYVLASHVGKEKGHQVILDYLHLRSVLNLDLSLGEGSGALLCYPIVTQALHLYQKMESFSEANVTNSVQEMKKRSR